VYRPLGVDQVLQLPEGQFVVGGAPEVVSVGRTREEDADGPPAIDDPVTRPGRSRIEKTAFPALQRHRPLDQPLHRSWVEADVRVILLEHQICAGDAVDVPFPALTLGQRLVLWQCPKVDFRTAMELHPVATCLPGDARAPLPCGRRTLHDAETRVGSRTPAAPAVPSTLVRDPGPRHQPRSPRANGHELSRVGCQLVEHDGAGDAAGAGVC
jgi:hypothetical protein